MKNAIEHWNYDKAVAELKPLVNQWKEKTIEVVRLLYKANKELRNSGYRKELENMYRSTVTTSCKIAQGSPKTFSDFCEEIGLSKRTAYSWLALYDAEEDRLLSTEEAKERALAIRDELFETVRQMRTKDSSWCPEKWNERLEKQYALWLIEKKYETFEISDNQTFLAGPDDGLYEFGLINRTYIHDIGIRATRRMTGDNAVRFDTITSRYKTRIPAGVNPHEVMRIPELALAALEDFPIPMRRQIAIVTAEAFRDLALEENQ